MVQSLPVSSSTRHRTIPYDGDSLLACLRALSGLHRPVDIARRLGVSRQDLHKATRHGSVGLPRIVSWLKDLETETTELSEGVRGVVLVDPVDGASFVALRGFAAPDKMLARWLHTPDQREVTEAYRGAAKSIAREAAWTRDQLQLIDVCGVDRETYDAAVADVLAHATGEVIARVVTDLGGTPTADGAADLEGLRRWAARRYRADTMSPAGADPYARFGAWYADALRACKGSLPRMSALANQACEHDRHAIRAILRALAGRRQPLPPTDEQARKQLRNWAKSLL